LVHSYVGSYIRGYIGGLFGSSVGGGGGRKKKNPSAGVQVFSSQNPSVSGVNLPLTAAVVNPATMLPVNSGTVTFSLAGTTKITDLFAGTVNTLLTSHTPNSGAPSPSAPLTNSNEFKLNGAGGAIPIATSASNANAYAPLTSQLAVQATVTATSSIAGDAGVFLRDDGNFNAQYFYCAVDFTGNLFVLYEFTGGALHVRASTSFLGVLNTPYTIKCVVNAANLFTCTLNGGSQITYTSSNGSTQNLAGIAAGVINSACAGLVITGLTMVNNTITVSGVSVTNGIATTSVTPAGTDTYAVTAVYSGASGPPVLAPTTSPVLTQIVNASFVAPWQPTGLNVTTAFGANNLVNDGSTDNTVNAQAIYNAIANGTNLYWPQGSGGYRIDGCVVPPTTLLHFSMRGDFSSSLGPGTTITNANPGTGATATCTLAGITAAVVGVGSGYANGDVIQTAGETAGTATRWTVTTDGSSHAATVAIQTAGSVTVGVASPAATTAITGTGAGCTLNINYGVIAANITRTAAGSGYTQPPFMKFLRSETNATTVPAATCTLSAGAVQASFTVQYDGSNDATNQMLAPPTITFSACPFAFGRSNQSYRCQLSNLAIVAPITSAKNGIALWTEDNTDCSFVNMSFTGYYGLYLEDQSYCLRLSKCTFPGTSGTSNIGLFARGTTCDLVEDSTFTGWTTGISQKGSGFNLLRNTITGNGTGVSFGTTDRTLIYGNTLHSNNTDMTLNGVTAFFQNNTFVGDLLGPGSQSLTGLNASGCALVCQGNSITGNYQTACQNLASTSTMADYASTISNSGAGGTSVVDGTSHRYTPAGNIPNYYATLDDPTAYQVYRGVHDSSVLNITVGSGGYALVNDSSTDNLAAFNALVALAAAGTISKVWYWPAGPVTGNTGTTQGYKFSATADASSLPWFEWFGDGIGKVTQDGSHTYGTFLFTATASPVVKADWTGTIGTCRISGIGIGSNNGSRVSLYLKNAVSPCLDDYLLANTQIQLANCFQPTTRSIAEMGTVNNIIMVSGGSYASLSGINYNTSGECIRMAGDRHRLVASRWETAITGFNGGLDISGNPLALTNFALAGLSIEACDTAMSFQNCQNGLVAAANAKGSTNAIGGVSIHGFNVYGTSNNITFANANAGAQYSGFAGWLQDGASSIVFIIPGNSNSYGGNGASVTVTESGGAVTGTSGLSGGSGFSPNAPSIVFQDTVGLGATGHTTLSGAAVASVVVDTPGTNYTSGVVAVFGGMNTSAYVFGPQATGITSVPAPAIAPTSLPVATNGTPYSQTLSTSGGFSPYTYAVTVGTLPTGLTLSTGGVLSGTPSVSGNFSFTVTSTDRAVQTATQAYTLTVAANFGYTTAGASNTAFGNNTIIASGPYTPSVTAPMQSLSVNLNAAAGNVQLSMYVDNGGTSTLSTAPVTGAVAFTGVATWPLGNTSGTRVYIYSASDPTQVMVGSVTSYSGTTLNVTVGSKNGVSTKADWVIATPEGGAKICETASTAATTSWNTIVPTTLPTATAGVLYWLVMNFSQASGCKPTYTPANFPKGQIYKGQAYGTNPATFPLSCSDESTLGQWSIYGTN
jgi:hypothetical protein